eukprot:CAMPEP_0197461418 /NCGR_PEP_ID=MMETSP1175-20131217/56502_1 /TAXON_ID=1003142 /ORGANISM="Triceratium dubium, Strain CCMP147" /LENGTH=80 /DNA_ID=CAMNT_0042996687 /DNA_START=62 /DNA_END=300 /DNA_ORIENTATION=-
MSVRTSTACADLGSALQVDLISSSEAVSSSFLVLAMYLLTYDLDGFSASGWSKIVNSALAFSCSCTESVLRVVPRRLRKR